MSTTDEESSNDSPSPSASPEGSTHTPYAGLPNLARLVGHLVAAKRSLSSSSHVYRATELVTVSRSLIEDLAVLNGKNAFASRALETQVDILDNVRQAVIKDCDQAADQFTTTLEGLDRADLRLNATLKALRQTVVDASLQRRGTTIERSTAEESKREIDVDASEQNHSEENETGKNLFDFIDEGTHKTLLTALYSLIDTYHDARRELDISLEAYDKSLRTVDSALRGDSGLEDKPTIYDEPPSTLEHLFRSLESHATEIANLLHNLVNHYDLCVTALKQTEGGGEAAKKAIQAADDLSKDIGDGEFLFNTTAPAEPMTDGERIEMLNVLENDALEVEEVVMDIQSLASEMESQYSQLQKRTANARSWNKNLRSVLGMLQDLRRHDDDESLSKLVTTARTFSNIIWPDLHMQLEAKTNELLDLCSFYEQFRESYALLLEEVHRRKTSAAQIERVALKAQKDLHKMYEAEKRERDDFMKDVGGFLPRDIWTGLAEDDAAEHEIKWTVRND